MRRQQILTVEISLDTPELPLPEADAVLLFHSIRELLFNVLKHGKTDRASVLMSYDQDVLSITVSDHGCGFEVSDLSDDESDQFGLLSVRERMIALGGGFDLQSEPGKGTVVSLHLPFKMSHEHIEAKEGEGRSPVRAALVGGHDDPNVTIASVENRDVADSAPCAGRRRSSNGSRRFMLYVKGVRRVDGGWRGVDRRASTPIGRHTWPPRRDCGHEHARLEWG